MDKLSESSAGPLLALGESHNARLLTRSVEPSGGPRFAFLSRLTQMPLSLQLEGYQRNHPQFLEKGLHPLLCGPFPPSSQLATSMCQTFLTDESLCLYLI